VVRARFGNFVLYSNARFHWAGILSAFTNYGIQCCEDSSRDLLGCDAV
jgi:hypothetical protein